MTALEVYKKGKEFLCGSGVESPEFDAAEILRFCCGVSRQDLMLGKGLGISKEDEEKFFACINQRCGGRPLQYILGEWSFMGLNFKVGEGVLIPRDDTEVLVREALECAKNFSAPKILDLCSGSGAIAISLAKCISSSEVTAVEISNIAYSYLCENINLNKIKNIRAVQADVLLAHNNINFEKFDLIVSNPPYIPSCEINTLQREVLCEPRLALDGGEDGLVFYRCILRDWKKFLNPGGSINVEIGIGQSSDVAAMFEENGFCNIRIIKDINDIDRVVCGKLK